MSNVSDRMASRILDAQLHVEADLSAAHSVRSLARVAGLSPFHFQRLFKRVTGESVGKQLRRLRIERGAFLLKRSDAPVNEIAGQCGFGTTSGFTRAFHELFGISPTRYRDHRSIRPFLRLHGGQTNPVDKARLEACPLTVWIESLPEWRVAVRRFVGPVEQMPSVWPPLIECVRDAGLLHDDPILLGLYSDDWDEPDPQRYRYDVGIVLGDEPVPTGLSLLTIPGGDVAMTSFCGSIFEFDRTWRRFVEDWLPASGCQFRTTFAFDRYPAELFAGSRPRQIMKSLRGIRATLCLPVQSR